MFLEHFSPHVAHVVTTHGHRSLGSHPSVSPCTLETSLAQPVQIIDKTGLVSLFSSICQLRTMVLECIQDFVYVLCICI